MRRPVHPVARRAVFGGLAIALAATCLPLSPRLAAAAPDDPVVPPAPSAPLSGSDRPPPATPPSLLTADQLEQLVAPVALYPDIVLDSLLPATSAPDDVSAAAQFVASQGGVATVAPEGTSWEPAVTALLQFPDVLRWLDQNRSWAEQVGYAMSVQPQDVLGAVQNYRRKANEAGVLASNEYQNVTVQPAGPAPVIVIEPVAPEVVYVPVYDPWALYGAGGRWGWGSPFYSSWSGFWFGSAGVWAWDEIGWDSGRYRIYGHHRPWWWNRDRRAASTFGADRFDWRASSSGDRPWRRSGFRADSRARVTPFSTAGANATSGATSPRLQRTIRASAVRPPTTFASTTPNATGANRFDGTRGSAAMPPPVRSFDGRTFDGRTRRTDSASGVPTPTPSTGVTLPPPSRPRTWTPPTRWTAPTTTTPPRVTPPPTPTTTIPTVPATRRFTVPPSTPIAPTVTPNPYDRRSFNDGRGRDRSDFDRARGAFRPPPYWTPRVRDVNTLPSANNLPSANTLPSASNLPSANNLPSADRLGSAQTLPSADRLPTLPPPARSRTFDTPRVTPPAFAPTMPQSQPPTERHERRNEK